MKAAIFFVGLSVMVYAQSPGDTIGWTTYDLQTIGPSGRRIAVDSERKLHAFWQADNGIFYNYREERFGDWRWPEGILVAANAGHPQVAVDPGDIVYVAFYTPDSYVTFCSINPYDGLMECYDPPDLLDNRCNWPYMTIDRSGFVHIVMCENSPDVAWTLAYTASINGGESWTTLARVDTVTAISDVIAASPVSDKVSIVYAHPTDLNSQWMNDIYYIESEDGFSWDWATGKVNVTEYGEDEDSLFAFTDLDAIYDYNDDLHIVWNAQWVTEEQVYVKTFLFHWSDESGSPTEVNSSDSVWSEGCNIGIWNRPICKMSLSINEQTNYMVLCYTGFDATDCSAGDYANGDIFMQYSYDRGDSWSYQINLTNSRSPGCNPGDCDSDHWPSVADRFHEGWDGIPWPYIVYINDKDGGTHIGGEGEITVNPVMFLDYVPTGIESEDNPPTDFSTLYVYPNPFNAGTTIRFSLSGPLKIKLEIFDIGGRLVETLAEAEYPAGENCITWGAGELSSGVYFARLSSSSENASRKLILLK